MNKNNLVLYHKSKNKKYLHKYYNDHSYQSIYVKPKPKWLRKFAIMAKIMNISTGEKILDVGCANKMFKKYVERNGGVYKGMDIAEGFKPEFVSDAETFKGVNEKFDWVVMSDVLEHLESPQKALQSAKKVGKRIIIVVPNWYRLERWGELLPRSSRDRHLQRMSPEKWKRLIEKTGWNMIHVQGFYYIPSIAFYPLRILKFIDRLFLIFPIRILSYPIDEYLSDKSFWKYLGQEIIFVAERDA